jgi:hypothetical protein
MDTHCLSDVQETLQAFATQRSPDAQSPSPLHSTQREVARLQTVSFGQSSEV